MNEPGATPPPPPPDPDMVTSPRLVLSYDAPAEPRVPLGQQIWAVVGAILIFLLSLISGSIFVMGCLSGLHTAFFTFLALLGFLCVVVFAVMAGFSSYQNSMHQARVRLAERLKKSRDNHAE